MTSPTTHDPQMPTQTDLAQAFAPTESELTALHDKLAAEADAAGLVDIAYRHYDSPIGSLLLAATERGLVRVGFEVTGHDRTLQELADRVSPRVLSSPARLDGAARALDAYFDGTSQGFGLALDWRLATGFRGVVQRHLPDIPYGHTATYAEVARTVDNPKAVRAVGSACATNPLPVVVPCHRVLRSDGGLGGYLGGVDVKRQLLNLEAEHCAG